MFGESGRNEERLVMLFVQLEDRVIHKVVIGHLLVPARQGRNGQFAGNRSAVGGGFRPMLH